MGALNLTTTECLMKFKMVCFSAKCCGQRICAKGKIKFTDKFVRDCPDCGHALFKDTGKRGDVKDQKAVSRPTAEFGFRTIRKYYDENL